MNVVALMPAKDAAGSVAATVAALRSIDEIGRVVVIDDGSVDATAEAARTAGATVLRLPDNVGKGKAVAAGVAATPEAEVYVLIDADVGESATAATKLLSPVLAGHADMTVGVLPAAGRRGGFGIVRSLAAAGIRRAVGFESRAPLSGQRAVRADLVRGLTLASRFGLETGLTIDAVRAGARVLEVPVVMEHRHTGRSVAGFAHRGRQGANIVAALWPRLTSTRQRLGVIALGLVLALTGASWFTAWARPTSVPLAFRPSKVVVFGMPGLGFADLGSGHTPHLDRVAREGAVAAMSVRTQSARPSTSEGYASLGAGARVRAGSEGGLAYAADYKVEGRPAREVAAVRMGREPNGEVVVVGAPVAIRASSKAFLSSEAGALGQALHDAGLRTGVVSNADNVGVGSSLASFAPPLLRPAAIAVMDRSASVDVGTVSPENLLGRDPSAPWGWRSDTDKVIAQIRRVMAGADVVVIDPGDLDRAEAFRPVALDVAAQEVHEQALVRTDALLGQVRSMLVDDTLLLVVAVTPPTGEWSLTPLLASGPGVGPGYLHSPSTKRAGLVTITDLAPTILSTLGAPVPDGMVGHSLQYRPGQPDLAQLARQDRDADVRESVYFPMILAYIVFQALVYSVAILAFSRGNKRGRARVALQWAVLAIAAYPLATFVTRAIPRVSALGAGMVLVVLVVDVALVVAVRRARGHPLSPLAWILGATAWLLVIDLCTGAHLQQASLLGYSPYTAGRFFGIGNAAFAVLAACSLLAACIHVQYAPRRREALVAAAAFLMLVVIADGAPNLGGDVGGILTLVPVFSLTLWVLSGRRFSWKAIALMAAVTMAVLVVAVAFDLWRAADQRTHLARFFSESDALTTIGRKITTNLRVLSFSIWTWMVPIIATFMLYLLVWEGRWRELLPPRSALRAGVVGTLGAGLLGFATNDSGVVVTALVFVYLGPFLTFLALKGAPHGEGQGQAALLAPLGPPASATSVTTPAADSAGASGSDLNSGPVVATSARQRC